MSPINRFLIAIAVFAIVLWIGGNILTYFFSGLLIFGSFVVMVQNIGWLKSFVYRTNRLMDIAIFAFALYSKVHFGVTIAMSITIAGLLYSFIYVPYLRAVYDALAKQRAIEKRRRYERG